MWPDFFNLLHILILIFTIDKILTLVQKRIYFHKIILMQSFTHSVSFARSSVNWLYGNLIWMRDLGNFCCRGVSVRIMRKRLLHGPLCSLTKFSTFSHFWPSSFDDCFLMIVNLIHQLIRLYMKLWVKVEKFISLIYFVANLGSKPTNNETAYSHITIKDWIKSFPFEFIYAWQRMVVITFANSDFLRRWKVIF